MSAEIHAFKSKSWGVIPVPGSDGEFHTGWEGEWSWPGGWEFRKQHGDPKDHMLVGQNAVFRARSFKVTGFGRGRSAANFYGHFKGSTFKYEMGMEGTAAIFDGLQDGGLVLDGGYIIGDWTFAKQGQSIFLRPSLKVSPTELDNSLGGYGSPKGWNETTPPT
jgi:hypothetical protein